MLPRILMLTMLGAWAGTTVPAHAEPSSPAGATTPEQPVDTGWRRTANGWEHISTWPRETASYDPPAPSARVDRLAPRLNVHPAAVALAQVIVAIGALVWLPRRREPA